MCARPNLLRSYRSQSTIGSPVSAEGFGFWSGRDVRVEFQPAAADTGIVFVRQDLGPDVSIPAIVECCTESPRRTTLSQNGATVEMVEHLMAALAAMRIDNCHVLVDAPEMPGFDGSSRVWISTLQAADRIELDAPRDLLVVTDRIRVGTDEAWVEAAPSRHTGMSARVHINYGTESPIGRQTYELHITRKTFCEQLADARTFILQGEADWLVSQGWCQRVTPSDVLVFADLGLIDNELRFPDECVRHKMLDLVGDLALAGCDVSGHFVAHRSGHRLNAALVRALLSEFSVIHQSRRSA